jgi:hypothetical protein
VAVSLFTFVGMYERVVGTAEHLLDKGVEFAKAKGISEAEMLEWRLIDDMFPLRNQFQTVVNFPKQFMARAVGADVPEAMAGESTVAELQAALAETKAYLAGLKPEQFAGRDDVTLTVSLGQLEPTLPIGQWISGFATTNLYFHLSTAYGILRSRGVEIGKRDLFAGGL